MLKKEEFQHLFGDWWEKIEPLFDGGEMDRIFSFLKGRGRKGKIIAPESKDLFKCFEYTNYSDLKCVIAGMAPYHSLRNNVVIADGLMMSCEKTGILQPSLEKFYYGIENELYKGLNLEWVKNPSTEYLAVQGVFMYNVSLTTEIGKPGSHLELWYEFSKYLFENVISLTGVPVIFLGKEAARFSRYLAPMQWKFSISHPASAAYNNTEWETEGTFGKVNKILNDMNGEKIEWLPFVPF